MKIRLLNTSILLLLFIASSLGFAGASGPLFNISSFGAPANVSITPCLNAKGPLSCQTYTVSALNFRISTTIPNHLYSLAGIKINTPGYTLVTTCTSTVNGYCMFAVSDTTSKVFSLSTGAQHYAYVTNSSNNTVSWCSIGASGALSNCDSTNGGGIFNSPSSIALDLGSARAYITNFSGDTVSRCNINTQTGALEGCQNNAGFSGPRAIALNSAKTFAYVTNVNNLVLKCTINSGTGLFDACVDSNGTGYNGSSGIAINSAGTVAYVTDGGGTSVFYCPVDALGNLGACLSTGSDFSNPARVTVNTEGNFAYITNSNTSNITLCSINKSTGELYDCKITASTLFAVFGNMAVNEAGTIAYVPNSNADLLSVCSVDGNGTLSGCVDSGGTTFSGPQGVAVG